MRPPRNLKGPALRLGTKNSWEIRSNQIRSDLAYDAVNQENHEAITATHLDDTNEHHDEKHDERIKLKTTSELFTNGAQCMGR